MDNKNEILEGLNDNQKLATTTTEGPILIVAGAGSGKTRTLTHRLAYLISKRVEPEKILMATFTNKAANEMRERVGAILKDKEKARKPFIGTFHQLGVLILRSIRGGCFGRGQNFIIFDANDSKQSIKNCLKELDLPKEQFSYFAVSEEISRAKNKLLNSSKYKETAENFFQKNVANVYELYEKKLEENNAFDFDDLIFKVVSLFKKDDDLLKKYQDRWQYVMVDEYQDTNFSQYCLINFLAKKNRNICAVGDDDQAIYSWRQADLRNFLEFEKDWKGAKIIFLGENYRSSKAIISAAQKLIENNKFRKSKKLYTNNKEGNLVNVIPLRNDFAEVDFIIKKIEYLKNKNNWGVNDFAILYRTNAQSRIIEEGFLKNRVDYQIYGGMRFYERRETKDLISYLRVINDKNDLVSLERIINVPSRKIGDKKKEIIFDKTENIDGVWRKLEMFPEAKIFMKTIIEGKSMIQEGVRVADLTGFLIEAIGYKKYLLAIDRGKERWENVLELLRISEEKEFKGREGLANFLDRVSLFQESEGSFGDSKNNSGVKMMTIHSAKGLEFRAVFIVGMEEGLLPHSQSKYSDDDLEEERRLAYVGMTRARDDLYLLFAQKRKSFGGIVANTPSRFLSEIPNDLVRWEGQPVGLLDNRGFSANDSGDDLEDDWDDLYDEDGIGEEVF